MTNNPERGAPCTDISGTPPIVGHPAASEFFGIGVQDLESGPRERTWSDTPPSAHLRRLDPRDSGLLALKDLMAVVLTNEIDKHPDINLQGFLRPLEPPTFVEEATKIMESTGTIGGNKDRASKQVGEKSAQKEGPDDAPAWPINVPQEPVILPGADQIDPWPTVFFVPVSQFPEPPLQ